MSSPGLVRPSGSGDRGAPPSVRLILRRLVLGCGPPHGQVVSVRREPRQPERALYLSLSAVAWQIRARGGGGRAAAASPGKS